MTQPFLTQRLWRHHLDADLLADHLAMIRRNRQACDCVWLTSAYGFPPLAVHEDQARKMAEVAPIFRHEGIGTCLQIANTIGHGDFLKSADFSAVTDPMVGEDGVVNGYAWCPRSPEMHAYLDRLVRAYCAWQPDRVWVDDDLRARSHAPSLAGCYCDRCLAAFSTPVGRTWQREALAQAINERSDLATRAAWIAFGCEGVKIVASVFARAATETAPDCHLGLEHVDSWFANSQPDWKPVIESLRDGHGRLPASRPGGGFYFDHQPREMLEKMLLIGRQAAGIPSGARPVTYECENFPAQRFGKSAHGLGVECALAIAEGCDSLSFTFLQFTHETTWHERMLETVVAWRPFWERFAAANVDTRATGVALAISPDHAIQPACNVTGPYSWAGPKFWGLGQAMTIGLPLCWSDDSPAAWIAEPAAGGMQEADLRRLMERGLLIDGAALAVLAERGLDGVLGVGCRPVTEPVGDLLVTDDPLNAEHAGTRLLLCNFMSPDPVTVDVADGDARVLSRYLAGDAPADPEAVAIERADGSRMVVFGWGLGKSVVATARREEVLAAADWVSHGRLPVRVCTVHPLVIVPRVDGAGKLATALLLNVSLDPSPPIEITLSEANAGSAWTWIQPFGGDIAVPAGRRITLPPLAAWNVGVLMRA